jgi:dihydrofolate reductase
LRGGADGAEQFMKYKIFEEYQILIHPIVLGKGKPLFRRLPRCWK